MRTKAQACSWAVLLAGLLSGAPAQADPAFVQFPSGWTVTEAPGPAADGHPSGRSSRRAMLYGDAHSVVAAIEWTTVPEPADLSFALGTMIAEMERGADDVYRPHGLVAAWDPAQPFQVDGHSGLLTTGKVRRDSAVVVQQKVVMWATRAALYSLSFSAPAASFDLQAPRFDEVLASIHAP